MRLLSLSLLLVIAASVLASRASAYAPAQAQQSPIVVTAQTLDVKFPRSMRFTIAVTSQSPIQVLTLTVRQRGVALGTRYNPPFTPSTQVQAAFEWNFQARGFGGYLPPGTHGEYTWHIEDAAGNVFDTPPQAYIVEDRTEQWQTLTKENISVHWHAGDQRFGNAVINRAIAARDFLTDQLGVQDADPLEIYIYADAQEFFSSLPAFTPEWTGGRMFPDYGVILINFAPDRLDWGLRATSHELSHAILHAKVRGMVGELSLPHWLDEGLAVYNETNNHAPDEQFDDSFQTALRRNSFIPLRKIQDRFPNDPDQAELAYAESYSVIKFMVEEYGAPQFAQLLNVYQKGALPDEAIVQVYGMNQDQLENAWRKKIGAPERAVTNLGLPTVPPHPTFEISSPLSGDSPTPTLVPTAEPTSVSVNDTPVSAPSVPASFPNVPTTSMCGGTLAFIGLLLVSRLKKIK